MNLGFLSGMIQFGMLNILTTCYKNRSATLGAVMLSYTGASITRLLALSITVMIPLNPYDIHAKYEVHSIVIEPSSRWFRQRQRPWWALGTIVKALTRGSPCHVFIHVCSHVRPPDSQLQSLQRFLSPQGTPQSTFMQPKKRSFMETTFSQQHKHLKILQNLVQGRVLFSPMQSEVPIIALGMNNQWGKLRVTMLLM